MDDFINYGLIALALFVTTWAMKLDKLSWWERALCCAGWPIYTLSIIGGALWHWLTGDEL